MPSLLILKVLSATFIVLSLAWVTERISPRAAGVLSGFPLGALLVTFFVGIEQGPQFGSETALAMVVGLTACLAFLTTYWKVSQWYSDRDTLLGIFLAALISLAIFLLVASVLSKLELSALLAFTISISASAVAILVLRKIPNVEIKARARLSPGVLLLRATTAILIVLLITYFASSLGSYWSGLLASFPITILPVLLIIHRTYSASHTWPIIKNYPFGMGGTVFFGLSCHYLYPLIGVKLGTLVALAVASLYLAMVTLVIKRSR